MSPNLFGMQRVEKISNALSSNYSSLTVFGRTLAILKICKVVRITKYVFMSYVGICVTLQSPQVHCDESVEILGCF